MVLQIRLTNRNFSSICGKSIHWILNWRAQDYWRDKHTEATLNWTKQQSRFIDHYGWESWLKSTRSNGYPPISSLKKDIPRMSNNNTN